jgi:hypothetical protein
VDIDAFNNLQTALDQTNAAISDIATIRSNAANGNNA